MSLKQRRMEREKGHGQRRWQSLAEGAQNRVELI
jgi:hypothetical protein